LGVTLKVWNAQDKFATSFVLLAAMQWRRNRHCEKEPNAPIVGVISATSTPRYGTGASSTRSRLAVGEKFLQKLSQRSPATGRADPVRRPTENHAGTRIARGDRRRAATIRKSRFCKSRTDPVSDSGPTHQIPQRSAVPHSRMLREGRTPR